MDLTSVTTTKRLSAAQRLADSVSDALEFMEQEARGENLTLFQCRHLCDHPYCILMRGLSQYQAVTAPPPGAGPPREA